MPSPNVDPNAIPAGEPVGVGRPAAEAQEHPPVWDSHPSHHKWEYVQEMGGWVRDYDPDSLCNSVAAIPFQPTFGYPPPHPRCLLGECGCGAEAPAS
ncbi:hypothetical protein [Pseudonocardia zijingensis]|jgi:hypothetical protein|uniref:Uncharacterized protein n=1 Tax=Pseudonocardia zijingensis TaxID=153376 RepID=A0ABP3ZCR1_9PSEU